MTLQIPQGASTINLPTGMQIQVPQGASQMDVPDELFKQKQYAGGFNKPETKGWTQDEIDNELSSPFQKLISSIKPSPKVQQPTNSWTDIINPLVSIGEFKSKQPAREEQTGALGAVQSIGKTAEQVGDFFATSEGQIADPKANVQQYAIDAMKEVDTLDASSKWSEIYKTLKDQNRPEAEEAKQRLYKAYDDAFKQRDIGRLGKAEDGELFLIQKNGEHLSLDSLVDNLQGDMKANKGVIGAGIAGGIKGAEYGSKLHPVYGSILGGLAGSAASTFGGSVADTAFNSYKNIRDFDGQFALEKAGQEALVDGMIGGTLEAGIKGVKYIGKGANALKEYAIDGNINGARSLATKEAGMNPSQIHADRSSYETVANNGAREFAQDELASAAMSRERLWNEVAPEPVEEEVQLVSANGPIAVIFENIDCESGAL